MTKKVVVFMAEGFEEMELTISVDVIRRAGIDVKIAGLNKEIKPVTGSRGMKMIPDISIDEVDTDSIDLIILPGGLEGTRNLGENDKVLSIVKTMAESGKKVAAICAAPAVLNRVGVLVGKTATSHPAAKDYMKHVNYSEERVVVDGNIITSRAAGTAFEFAFRIIKELIGESHVSEVNKGVLAKL